MPETKKLDLLMEKMDELDDDDFEQWLDDQPEEEGYGSLFYNLMFPDIPKEATDNGNSNPN